MPSEFNHIDQFIRAKVSEVPPDVDHQAAHWTQMQQMLAGKSPVPVRSRQGFRWISIFAAVAVLGSIFLFFLLHDHSSDTIAKHTAPSLKPATENAPTAVVDTRNTFRRASGPESTNNDDQFRSATGHRFDHVSANQRPKVPFQPLPATSETVANNPSTTRITQGDAVDPSLRLQDFFDQISDAPQTFSIDNSRDTTITCAGRSELFIPAFAFANPDTSIRKQVEIRISECYALKDIIAKKLSTRSGEALLATGGMLNIRAFDGNQELNMAPGLSLRLSMPTTNFDPGMQLFYGHDQSPTGSVADKTLPHNIDWKPAGQMQGFFDEKMLVTVIDLLNDPRSITTKNGRRTAHFVLSEDSPISLEEARKKLFESYGYLYHSIKVRRGWRSVYRINGDPKVIAEVQKLQKEKEGQVTTNSGAEFIDHRNGLIGDSVRMNFQTAVSLNLISPLEKRAWEDKFRRLFESSSANGDFENYLALKKNYVFDLDKTGWINCDRFLASKKPGYPLTVDAGSDMKSNYLESFIVLHQSRTVMLGHWKNGQVVFQNLPEDQACSIICVGVRNGKTVCAIIDSNTSMKEVSGLNFTETNPSEFQSRMERFGNVQKG